MSVEPIRVWGDPVLRQRAEEADPHDPQVKTLVDTMLETMRDAQGLGLAAPQIGVSLRVAVVDRRAVQGEEDLILVNPVIEVAWGQTTIEEGCLSLPGVWAEVKRAIHVKVRYVNLEGQERVLRGDDMLAVALQHEVDHLNGILLVDRVSPQVRQALAGTLERIRAEGRA